MSPFAPLLKLAGKMPKWKPSERKDRTPHYNIYMRDYMRKYRYRAKK